MGNRRRQRWILDQHLFTWKWLTPLCLTFHWTKQAIWPASYQGGGKYNEAIFLGGRRTRSSCCTGPKLPWCLDRLHQSVDPDSALGWWQTQRTVLLLQTQVELPRSFPLRDRSFQWGNAENSLRRCPEKTPSFKNIIIKRISQTTDYTDQEQLCGCVLSWEADSPRVSVQAWGTQDFCPFSSPKISICKISYSQSTVHKTWSNANIKTNLPVSL